MQGLYSGAGEYIEVEYFWARQGLFLSYCTSFSVGAVSQCVKPVLQGVNSVFQCVKPVSQGVKPRSPTNFAVVASLLTRSAYLPLSLWLPSPFPSCPQRVLERAADNHGLTVEELQRVPEGSTRRSMHDDITCVVFFLKGNHHNDGFGALKGSKVQGAAAREGGSGGAPAQ